MKTYQNVTNNKETGEILVYLTPDEAKLLQEAIGEYTLTHKRRTRMQKLEKQMLEDWSIYL